MKHTFLFVFMLSAYGTMAQKLTVQGQVMDTTGIVLPSATVMVLSSKDSSLVSFAVTNEHGYFELKNLPSAEYLLKITFVGYKTFSLQLKPSYGETMVSLGVLKMQVSRTALDEVVIADKIPVVVKPDTIEFNTAAFKTNKNANVEELLKKLPGVEVDQDGNVTAQGEKVRRVTVDGKDFFGGRDPKLATRNLPADAINKVQVLDRKSDQALFSGVDDGQREKSINLELKEEKRRGAFGTATAGYGTNDRYNIKTSINKFNRGSQLSFLGMSNNVNDQGFSVDDYVSFTGGARQMMAGGQIRIQIDGDNQNGVPLDFGNRANGLMQTHAGGVNFSNMLKNKTEINGSYFFNRLNHQKLQTTLRENFLQQGKYFYDENSEQDNVNENHRLSAKLDHKLDSVNTLQLSTDVSYSETSMASKTTSRNLTSNEIVLNENVSNSNVQGNTAAINSLLLFRHKFSKKGRNFSANVQFGLSQINREGILDASYNYSGESLEQVRQRNDQLTENLSYGGAISYVEPLGNRKYLEANYSFKQNRNNINRPVFDVHKAQEFLNDSLSNRYSSDYIYHRAALNFKLNRKKYTATVGVGIQQTELVGNLKAQEIHLAKSYQNFLPVARFSYDFSSTRHLKFDYETSVQEPSIQQLQPVVDNRDPLNPYMGNPNLRPAYVQRWRLNFTAFDPGTFVGFFALADVNYATNAISNSLRTENFIRTIMPVNVKDNIRVFADATFTFPITKLKSRFNISGNFANQRSTDVLDAVEYQSTQRTTGGNFRYNYRYHDIFNMSLGAELKHQSVDYEFNQPDQIYYSKTYTAETNLTIRKSYLFNASFDYLAYKSLSTNFSKSIPLLNLSLSRFVLKNNSGEIKVAVSNVLDKALGINQTSSINFVELVTTNSLGRYFMISFTYALNKQLNPMGMRPGGGMMRIIR